MVAIACLTRESIINIFTKSDCTIILDTPKEVEMIWSEVLMQKMAAMLQSTIGICVTVAKSVFEKFDFWTTAQAVGYATVLWGLYVIIKATLTFLKILEVYKDNLALTAPVANPVITNGDELEDFEYKVMVKERTRNLKEVLEERICPILNDHTKCTTDDVLSAILMLKKFERNDPRVAKLWLRILSTEMTSSLTEKAEQELLTHTEMEGPNLTDYLYHILITKYRYSPEMAKATLLASNLDLLNRDENHAYAQLDKLMHSVKRNESVFNHQLSNEALDMCWLRQFHTDPLMTESWTKKINKHGSIRGVYEYLCGMGIIQAHDLTTSHSATRKDPRNPKKIKKKPESEEVDQTDKKKEARPASPDFVCKLCKRSEKEGHPKGRLCPKACTRHGKPVFHTAEDCRTTHPKGQGAQPTA